MDSCRPQTRFRRLVRRRTIRR